jgi:hypothetical protein
MRISSNYIRALCAAATLSMAGGQALAQEPAAAPEGEAVIQATSVAATVKSVDQATRQVVLTTEEGQEVSFIAGEEVRNLPQLKAGDTVTVTYAEALAYEVRKGGSAVAAATEVIGGRAEPGAKPAAALAQQTTLTVMITAIDKAAPSVTFKGANGETRTIKVLHPEKLEGVNVGDTVEVTYTEAMAIKVTETPAK